MGEWKSGLFGCFDDIKVCLLAYFVPCYVHGKNSEAVGDDCMMCTLVTFVPLANLWFIAKNRQKVREQQGIDGGFGGDCITTWCCGCCSISQVAREVGSLNNTMAQSMARE